MSRVQVLDGFTAYGIAVKHGFYGTEEEWLESLRANGNVNPVVADETMTIPVGVDADGKLYAGKDPDVNQLKDELQNKLPKSPSNWEQWTAEEQAAARDRIGLGSDYEAILDVTVEEDCTQIIVTTDANGNPFKLKEVLLMSYLPASDKSGNYGMRLQYNGVTSIYAISSSMSSTSNTYSKHLAILHNGLWFVGGTNFATTLKGYSYAFFNLALPIVTKNDIPYIDAIDISQLNGGLIKAGAQIKLMGVKI